MSAYLMIMIVLAAALGVYVYHTVKRIMKFYGFNTSGKFLRMVNIALVIYVIVSCVNMWNTSAMVLLHIVALFILTDMIALVLKKLCKSWSTYKAYKVCRKLYGCGLLPVVITILLLGYGYENMKHVVKTQYFVETTKNVSNYRIVLITDTHYGTIQSPDILKNRISEINTQSPDIVILGGDIVEEGTSKESMQEIFGLLGMLNSKYGIYYVYGNHDRQPYTDSRSYTDEELTEAITENGISILEDENVVIQDDLVLAGRGDAAWGGTSGRASTEEILEGADRNKYIVMADHQPIAAEENNAQGVDLQLSGHTHAGQIWPVGWLSELAGVLNYGEYQKGNCKVIVSSGFTGWGYPVRTEGNCEYVIIDIMAVP